MRFHLDLTKSRSLTYAGAGAVALIILAAAAVSVLRPVPPTGSRPSLAPLAQGAGSADARLVSHSPAMSAPSGPEKVEQSARIRLTTRHVLADVKTLGRLAAAEGGYVAFSSEVGRGRRARASLALEVPAGDLSSVLGRISRLGHVTSLSQRGVNVTSRWNQLSLKILALQTESQAYRRLYAKATTIGDMLRIQRALAAVDAALLQDHEALTHLAHQVNLASIGVALAPAPVPPAARSWNPLVSSLRTMLDAGRAVLAGFLWIAPWVVLVGVLASPLWWRRSWKERPEGGG
jgi:hypothetical protein